MANSKLRFSPLSKTPHISLGWRWERNFCQSCRIGGKRCFLSAEWTIQVGGSRWESQSGDFLDQSAHWNFFRKNCFSFRIWNAADFSSQVRDVAKDVRASAMRQNRFQDFGILGKENYLGMQMFENLHLYTSKVKQNLKDWNLRRSLQGLVISHQGPGYVELAVTASGLPTHLSGRKFDMS